MLQLPVGYSLQLSDQIFKREPIIKKVYHESSTKKLQTPKQSQSQPETQEVSNSLEDDRKINLRYKKYSKDYNQKYPDFVEKPTSYYSNIKQSSEVMKNCHKILALLKKHDCASPFLNKVDPIALNIPDYFDIIKDPMDLTTISNNLRNGNYTSEEYFAADVRKIWNNSFLYNHKNTDIYFMTTEISQYFEDIYKDTVDNPNKYSTQNVAELSRKVERLNRELQELNYSKTKSKSRVKNLSHRQMTIQEKRILGQNIRKLPHEYLRGVWDIVTSGGQSQNDELEFDIDTLPVSKSRELEYYVKQKLALINKNLNRRKGRFLKKEEEKMNINIKKQQVDMEFPIEEEYQQQESNEQQINQQSYMASNNQNGQQPQMMVNDDSSESSFLTDSDESAG